MREELKPTCHVSRNYGYAFIEDNEWIVVRSDNGEELERYPIFPGSTIAFKQWQAVFPGSILAEWE